MIYAIHSSIWILSMLFYSTLCKETWIKLMSSQQIYYIPLNWRILNNTIFWERAIEALILKSLLFTNFITVIPNSLSFGWKADLYIHRREPLLYIDKFHYFPLNYVPWFGLFCNQHTGAIPTQHLSSFLSRIKSCKHLF